jgi:hypothetical protein
MGPVLARLEYLILNFVKGNHASRLRNRATGFLRDSIILLLILKRGSRVEHRV